MIDSKAKGSRLEREVAAKLSLWVSHGQSSDLFWRSSMSGGRATIAARKGRSIKPCGDLCAIDPLGHQLTDLYFIEVKHLKSIDLGTFIMHHAGPLKPIWTKVVAQAAQHARQPMLVVKENRRPTLVVTWPRGLAPVCSKILLGTVTNRTAEFSLFDELVNSHFGGQPLPPRRIPR